NRKSIPAGVDCSGRGLYSGCDGGEGVYRLPRSGYLDPVAAEGRAHQPRRLWPDQLDGNGSRFQRTASDDRDDDGGRVELDIDHRTALSVERDRRTGSTPAGRRSDDDT